jgi:hypothetical protein
VNRWKAILAVLVIFTAGAATGGFVVRTYAPRIVTRTHVTPALPISFEKRMEYVDKLDKEIQLTGEQRKKVENIIAASQARIKDVWRDCEPQLKEEYRRTRKEISEILSPEQQEKMKHFRKDRENRSEKEATKPRSEKFDKKC